MLVRFASEDLENLFDFNEFNVACRCITLYNLICIDSAKNMRDGKVPKPYLERRIGRNIDDLIKILENNNLVIDHPEDNFIQIVKWERINRQKTTHGAAANVAFASKSRKKKKEKIKAGKYSADARDQVRNQEKILVEAENKLEILDTISDTPWEDVISSLMNEWSVDHVMAALGMAMARIGRPTDYLREKNAHKKMSSAIESLARWNPEEYKTIIISWINDISNKKVPPADNPQKMLNALWIETYWNLKNGGKNGSKESTKTIESTSISIENIRKTYTELQNCTIQKKFDLKSIDNSHALALFADKYNRKWGVLPGEFFRATPGDITRIQRWCDEVIGPVQNTYRYIDWRIENYDQYLKEKNKTIESNPLSWWSGGMDSAKSLDAWKSQIVKDKSK